MLNVSSMGFIFTLGFGLVNVIDGQLEMEINVFSAGLEWS